MEKQIKQKAIRRMAGIIALVAIIAFTFTALSLTGCDTSNDATHTHQWGAWKSNATQHWKECSCGEEYGRANHNGNPCPVCEYNDSSHSHSYSETWSKDATQHWKECSCGDKTQVANHTGNPCICGYNSDTDPICECNNPCTIPNCQCPDCPGSGGNNISIWTEITNDVFKIDSSINGITWGSGKFVATQAGGKMAYSSDGIIWTGCKNKYGNALTNSYDNVAWGNGMFVAIDGRNSRGSVSTDGITWSMGGEYMDEYFFRPALSNTVVIAWGNNMFVAAGFSGKIAYSSDGTTWTEVENKPFFRNIRGITYGGGKFIIAAEYGSMAYSSDGIIWEAVADSTFGSSQVIDVAWNGERYVAVGDHGKMAYSINGTTWFAVADSTFGSFGISAIAYGNGKFVASRGYGQSAFSTDGISWTGATDTIFTGKWIDAIVWGNNKFIAVGQDGKIAYWEGDESGSTNDGNLSDAWFHIGRETNDVYVVYIVKGGTPPNEVIIPATYNGFPVISINGGVFENCTNITSVTIPDSVRTIYGYAFNGCTGLTSITIPSSVTSIRDSAFRDCTNLTSVTFECALEIKKEGNTYSTSSFSLSAFNGNLFRVYFAEAYSGDSGTYYGAVGTYTTTAPVGSSSLWTKKP